MSSILEVGTEAGAGVLRGAVALFAIALLLTSLLALRSIEGTSTAATSAIALLSIGYTTSSIITALFLDLLSLRGYWVFHHLDCSADCAITFSKMRLALSSFCFSWLAKRLEYSICNSLGGVMR